ncbi:hypothetical protein CC80DRAFT_550838 [Byssothecium circinans]|uniref:Uncharacterized protein n=1 Tax=Byssothecium circinans TaxID=147558 RepID=A0A6A5TT92_9PLEO|nr:hypothetical protein CC80DRAFT_550838 [Byssothecium circinans]
MEPPPPPPSKPTNTAPSKKRNRTEQEQEDQSISQLIDRAASRTEADIGRQNHAMLSNAQVLSRNTQNQASQRDTAPIRQRQQDPDGNFVQSLKKSYVPLKNWPKSTGPNSTGRGDNDGNSVRPLQSHPMQRDANPERNKHRNNTSARPLQGKPHGPQKEHDTKSHATQKDPKLDNMRLAAANVRDLFSAPTNAIHTTYRPPQNPTRHSPYSHVSYGRPPTPLPPPQQPSPHNASTHHLIPVHLLSFSGPYSPYDANSAYNRYMYGRPQFLNNNSSNGLPVLYMNNPAFPAPLAALQQPQQGLQGQQGPIIPWSRARPIHLQPSLNLNLNPRTYNPPPNPPPPFQRPTFAYTAASASASASAPHETAALPPPPPPLTREEEFARDVKTLQLFLERKIAARKEKVGKGGAYITDEDMREELKRQFYDEGGVYRRLMGRERVRERLARTARAVFGEMVARGEERGEKRGKER